ncbi:unnamed protein product [Symbiodinium sp. CCMP2592]|nr:unnamed protein product [Symbiodinium sp. CCMP2592]
MHDGNGKAAPQRLHRGRNFGAPVLWLLGLIPLLARMLQAKVNPARSFQCCYCAFIAVSLCWNHLEGHRSFYRWFSSSKIEPSQRRGLGHAGERIYGLLPAPKLSPLQHDAAFGVFFFSLLGSCLAPSPRLCLGVAFLCWFFYYSQIFCATKAGGHGSTLIPGTLLMMALSPTIEDTYIWKDSVEAWWALDFIKLQVAATYCGSGLCKIAGSLYFQQFWGNGTTLQAYTFDAMWSRPGGEFTWQLQAIAVQCPRTLVLAGTLSLLFEVCFPLALTSQELGTAFACAALAFHTGVYFLQGFDFLSQWCPVVLLFALPNASWQMTKASLRFGATSLGGLDLGLSLGFLYTACSMLVSLTMVDVWYGEVPPWSCCPMFLVPRNVFAPKMPRWWSMTGVPEQREAGFMDPLIYSPANAKHYLPKEDLPKFPYKILQFGCLSQVPKELQKFVRPECLQHEGPMLLFANFPVPKELKDSLERMVHLSLRSSPKDAWDSKKLREIVDLQRLCRLQFERADRPSKKPE